MRPFTIRATTSTDLPWMRKFWIDHWGDEYMIVNNELIALPGLYGFVAEIDGRVVGLATYRIQDNSCELLSIDSLLARKGIGSALLDAVIHIARSTGCSRLRLVTTNDNLNALRFYQMRGFHLCALRPGAVAVSRALKPTIPLLGNDDIPICDEIELEMAFDADVPISFRVE